MLAQQPGAVPRDVLGGRRVGVRPEQILAQVVGARLPCVCGEQVHERLLHGLALGDTALDAVFGQLLLDAIGWANCESHARSPLECTAFLKVGRVCVLRKRTRSAVLMFPETSEPSPLSPPMKGWREARSPASGERSSASSASFTASLLVMRRLAQYSASSCSTCGGRRTVRVMRSLRCNTTKPPLYYERPGAPSDDCPLSLPCAPARGTRVSKIAPQASDASIINNLWWRSLGSL